MALMCKTLSWPYAGAHPRWPDSVAQAALPCAPRSAARYVQGVASLRARFACPGLGGRPWPQLSCHDGAEACNSPSAPVVCLCII